MKITCVAVGKIKESYLKEAMAEYGKRLSRYCKLEIIELPDEKTPEGASQSEEQQIKEREGERILKALREEAYVIALDIQGSRPDSVEFSRKLENLAIQGKSHIAFVIGGKLLSHDLSPSADAGDSAGAGVPGVSDYERRTVSQVRARQAQINS